MKQDNCVFCNLEHFPEEQKIKIDDLFSVLLSLNPQTKGHLLIVPKEHLSELADMDSDLQTLLFQKAIEYGGILEKRLWAKAFVVKINNKLYTIEENSGHVRHIHIHVIPRYSANDKIVDKPKKASIQVLAKIKKEIIKI